MSVRMARDNPDIRESAFGCLEGDLSIFPHIMTFKLKAPDLFIPTSFIARVYQGLQLAIPT